MLQYALFDLDGTLTDPAPGITRCIAYALTKMGVRPPKDLSELEIFIGPPLVDKLCEVYGFSRADGERALAYYRERFGSVGLFENRVYDGIPALLSRLCARGIRPILATSKPEPYAVKILEHFGLAGYFAFVGGNDMAESRADKAAVIAFIRSRFPDLSPQNAVMVGDRSYDIEGAHAHALPAVGVLWGFAKPGELQAAGADYMAESVPALGTLIETL